MSQANAEMARWLLALREIVCREMAAAAAQLTRSIAPAVIDPAVSEELACAIFVLGRERDDLEARLRELFCRIPDLGEDSVLATPFAGAAAGDPAAAIRVVAASIAARTRLCRDRAALFDAHSRLLFRIHGCLTAELVQPALEQAARALAGPDQPGDRAAIDLEALYGAHLPTRHLVADDFLSLATLRP